jgi:C-terminal processing protease CtpA/Prc
LKILFSRPHDDYSFDPLSSDNGYNGHAIPRCYDDHTQFREESVTFEDKSSFHTSSLFNQSTIQKLDTPIRPAEKEYQHVFAPPGKVGVAIDVVDGNPIVHKVKSGSPLEGLLKPKDLVIAIDDVDTTRMSAADVTHLMVKRMNYRRKITFVRKDS